MDGGAHTLTQSLVLARVNARSQPFSEQQLLQRLQAAALAAGCSHAEFVTAVFVGFKLRWWSVVCGPARDRAMICLDALTTTVVGANSGQTLHIHGPLGTDAMAQRFAAVRLGDFVATALDQAEQNKAWFVLFDTPGDPVSMLRWLRQEIAAMLQAHGRPAYMVPPNLFVLGAAGGWPSQQQRGWLPLSAPRWSDPVAAQRGAGTPPVGYQRQLLQCQLTGAAYRQRLRKSSPWLHTGPLARAAGRAGQLRRWLVAGVDVYQQGLWVPADHAANCRKALAVLEPQLLRSARAAGVEPDTMA